MSIENFESLPLKCLRLPTIMTFCELLDIEQPIENDYRALLEHLNVSYEETARLKREVQSDTRYPSITMRLFCMWATQSIEDANAQVLMDFLTSLGRKDIYNEIKDALDDDLAIAKTHSEKDIMAEDISELWKKIEFPNTDERLFSSDLFNPIKMHDALILYNPNSEADEEWMMKIYDFLTNKGISIYGRTIHFRVAVAARDLLFGQDYASAYVRAIKYRCKRVILLISESFVKSSKCVFQMQIARSLDLAAIQRKVIPVRLDSAELPDLLLNIRSVNLNLPPKAIEREMRKLAMSLL